MKKQCKSCRIRRVFGTEKYYCPKCMTMYFNDETFLEYVTSLLEEARSGVKE